MIVLPNPVWAWVLLHFPDGRYQLPELGMNVKISSPTYMQIDPNLPPAFQQMQWKAQQRKNRNDTIKKILGFLLLFMGAGALIGLKILTGISFLGAGLLLFPFSFNEIKRRMSFNISRGIRYFLVVFLYAFGIIAMANDSEKVTDQRPIANKNSTPEIETTDSINVSGQKNTTDTEISDSDRKEKIEKLFSVWDGSNYYVVKAVKNSMNDPDSFEHIITQYWDKGDYIQVSMKFRGKNSFGAKVISVVQAKLNLEGEIISMSADQN